MSPSGEALQAGDVELWIADAAPRCVVTTLAQGRLEREKSVLATLAAHARKESDFGTFACFGTYAEVRTPGSIVEGDVLELLRPTPRLAC